MWDKKGGESWRNWETSQRKQVDNFGRLVIIRTGEDRTKEDKMKKQACSSYTFAADGARD